MREELLPHFNDRQTPVDMLMFHCSALSGEDILKTLDERDLSCHYVIDENAEIIKVIDENKRAYHAGLGFWKNIDTDLNSHSLGIEISNMSLGQEAYTEAQIIALIELSSTLVSRYRIRPDMIVGHSDTAPSRKADPGKAFPWKQLAKAGIGLWYQPRNADKMPASDIKELLAAIGYDTRTPEAVQASAYAFCRRFAPEFVHTDNDIRHLVDNILPDNFDFMNNPKFITTLKAVVYSYTPKNTGCNL